MNQTPILTRATIEYETLSKLQKPLKPIFVALRNCTPTGEPKE